MKPPLVLSDAKDALIEYGETALKLFHAAYEQNPVGTETEFLRGEFSGWKRITIRLYGESAADDMIHAVSQKAGLSIPPWGPLSPDGQGYLGWDSYCHMGFIGKLEEAPKN